MKQDSNHRLVQLRGTDAEQCLTLFLLAVLADDEAAMRKADDALWANRSEQECLDVIDTMVSKLLGFCCITDSSLEPYINAWWSSMIDEKKE
jgi:hypothetical protein